MTKQMIESNLTIFHEKALKLADIFSEYAENNELMNLKDFACRYSADILAASLFGHELNEIENNKWNLSDHISRALEMILWMLSSPPYVLSFAYTKYSAAGQEVYRHCKHVSDLCSEMINSRLKMKQNLGESLDETPKLYSDVIIQKAKHDNLKKDEIGKLCSDFFVAGIDPSSVTAASALVLLSMYPEHQEAVYKEQVEVLGEDTSLIPTSEQISRMTYLTRVINETLRLYSSPAISRYISKDIDVGQYVIPKGTDVYIMFHMLHRDPKYWSHPNEFYPDHFLPEESASRPKSVYFPFSVGPRSCPGKLYAMASLKILISILIRKYKFETDLKFEDIKPKYRLMWEIAQGYNVRIKPRKPSSIETPLKQK